MISKFFTQRRQVCQSHQEAVHRDQNPTGRTRLRIPLAALENLEGFTSAQGEDPLETLRSPEDQEKRTQQAVIWMREQPSAVPPLRSSPPLELVPGTLCKGAQPAASLMDRWGTFQNCQRILI